MTTNKHSRNYTLRLPVGLSERIETLAKKQRETPYGWMLRTLWRVSGWDGNNPNNKDERELKSKMGLDDTI